MQLSYTIFLNSELCLFAFHIKLCEMYFTFSINSNYEYFVPVGSPVCTIKPRITLWKRCPLQQPVRARPQKFSAARDTSPNSRTCMSPSDVCSTACSQIRCTPTSIYSNFVNIAFMGYNIRIVIYFYIVVYNIIIQDEYKGISSVLKIIICF